MNVFTYFHFCSERKVTEHLTLDSLLALGGVKPFVSNFIDYNAMLLAFTSTSNINQPILTIQKCFECISDNGKDLIS